MTKKILFGLFVCLACFAMVSCSMDGYAKLGELMGNMGNNVYGIKANMQDVEKTTATVDSSVSYETDKDGNPKKDKSGNVEVTVTVDNTVSTSIIESVASIKNSPQKTEELQKQLEQPISDNEDVAKAVQTKLMKVIENVPAVNNPEEIKNDSVKEAYNAVKTALSNIKDSITETPTKADLATVAIVNDLATAVTDLARELSNSESSLSEPEVQEKVLKQADKAFAALDALKVTTTAGTLDVLNDISFTSLLKSFTSGSSDNASGISKAGASKDESSTESDFDKYEKLLEDTLKSIVKMVSDEDGKFNDEKYNKFMFQLRAIRTAYEMTAWLVTPTLDTSSVLTTEKDAKAFAFIDALINGKSVGKNKFSTNDAVLYSIAFVLTEGEDFYKDYTGDSSKNVVKEVLKIYVENIANENGNKNDLKAKWDEIKELVNSFKTGDVSKDFETLLNKAKTALNTNLVIVLDAGFNLKGTLENFKVLSKVETTTYADAICKGLKELKKKLESKEAN